MHYSLKKSWSHAAADGWWDPHSCVDQSMWRGGSAAPIIELFKKIIVIIFTKWQENNLGLVEKEGERFNTNEIKIK